MDFSSIDLSSVDLRVQLRSHAIMITVVLLAVTAHANSSDVVTVEWADGIADAGDGRKARLAENIVRESEADTLMNIIETSEDAADQKRLDSTDRLPAYETYVRDLQNNIEHPAAPLLNRLYERMTAYASAEYSECAANCHLCSVLLRRYKPKERRRVQSHFDRNAIVTAVVTLNGGLEPPAFDGGLFLQRTASATSRQYFATSRKDAVFHSYDLNHGVEVHNGTRFSAIFWFSDTEESCKSGHSPWYLETAKGGSREAQEALGELYQIGSSGYERDPAKAAEWFTKASEQGSAFAATKLGRQLLAGEGVPRDKEAGMKWVAMAAEQGYAPAEYTMGVACQYGDVEGGLEAAAKWFEKAAEAGIAAAQYELGVAYINGDGVEAGKEVEGARWLYAAAAQGEKEAIEALAQLKEDPAWAQVEEALKDEL